MKTKIRRLALGGTAGVAFLAIAGCPEVAPDDTTPPPSGPTAATLFARVTETDPFQQWAQFPEAQGVIESAAPHGPMGRVWINSVVESALTDPAGTLPTDSIILKESLSNSTAEKANEWDIMWKVSDFDADNNDWFWVNVTPDGDVVAEGKIGGCIACHSGARDNDFVFLHAFSGGN